METNLPKEKALNARIRTRFYPIWDSILLPVAPIANQKMHHNFREHSKEVLQNGRRIPIGKDSTASVEVD